MFHSNIAEYTFFSAAHETVYKIGHILRHKASLNKFRKSKVTICSLSDHRIKLETNSRRKYRTYVN